MDRFFSFLSRNKSVFSFKNRSRTGKTDNFSSPDIWARKALTERYKLSAVEKTSYSICLSTLIAVTNTLPEALSTRTDLLNIGESTIVCIGTLKKIIILAACMYWDS